MSQLGNQLDETNILITNQLSQHDIHPRFAFVPFQYMRNSRGAKCALSLSSNPQDGPMGKAGIHSHPAQASNHEATTISAGQAHVMTSNLLRERKAFFLLHLVSGLCGK